MDRGSTPPRPVAGGVEPLREICRHLDRCSGMAFAVINRMKANARTHLPVAAVALVRNTR